ncbi:MAG: A24 family peptidase [Tissierellia bacterium]|nr:A24 family peptidase [Tissierellia bacterium]
MIFLNYYYLDQEFKDQVILNRGKYLVFLSILFIQRLDMLLISPILFVIAYIDLFKYKIPNKLNITLLCIGLFTRFVAGDYPFKGPCDEAILVFIFLILTFILTLYKDSLGYGDFKIFIVLALIKSPEDFLNMIFYLFIVLSISSLFAYFKTLDKKLKLPLGPLIYIAYLINEFI